MKPERAIAAAALLLCAGRARADDPPQTFTPEENTIEQVEIHGVGWSSPRGVGDVRVKRDQLDASPRQQTPEMLSAAPGFFVDHEDGEGLGNDVHVRGFDLDHGAGVEMRVGSIPINAPLHVLGQGYADVTFIIPEIVRGVRVLQGPYDPRQGDAAIAGSAYFDLGVAERGYHIKTTFGSFDQIRALAIVAPKSLDEESFAAFSARHSDGFGQRRASDSLSMNAQYGFDVSPSDHVRFTATAYSGQSSLAGVVRQDDVQAGRIGFYDSYVPLGQNQSVHSARIMLGGDFDHETRAGARLEIEPWFMWTNLDTRSNFTGDLLGPGLGDLFDLANVETAMGFTSRYHAAPAKLGSVVELVVEPGVSARFGHTEQGKMLLSPSDLTVWDRRLDRGLNTLDAGAYVDLDARIGKRLRISGGVRTDLLAIGVDDHLARSSSRSNADVVVGPRVTAEYEAARGFAVSASYGEGFRSLDASQPFTRVRSVEAGVRVQDKKKKWVTTLALFDTFVDSELVFEAESGTVEPEGASTRRGVVGSVVLKPWDWLLASAALSVTNAMFTSQPEPDDPRFVPNVAPILFRLDASVKRTLGRLRGEPITLRASVGYTFLARSHLTDEILGQDTHALNASLAVRWDDFEVGVDGYNVLNLQYADDAEVYASTWGHPASAATHISAAPPATVLATVALHL